MNEPFFSVVVCTYNQEDYISKTLDSIIEQEQNYPYEIIVGDDCSTDRTRDILLRYKQNYPDIIKICLNEYNLGLIKNYFSVINLCSGKYIMQCAGDDYWLPGKINTQISFMENNPDIGMCCGNAITLYENGKEEISDIQEGLHKFEDLLLANDIFALTACFRNKLLSEYIESVNPVNKNWLADDYPIWLYFLICDYKIYRLRSILAVYRYLLNSASHLQDYDKAKKFLFSTFDIRKYFLNLHDIPSFTEKLENKMNQELILLAVKYNQYEEYKICISKISDRGIKWTMKMFIRKHKWLFFLYHNYYKIRFLFYGV
jgi:glycosyltransferase involved in cell wall biosynthesis